MNQHIRLSHTLFQGSPIHQTLDYWMFVRGSSILKYFEHYNCIILQLKILNIRGSKNIGKPSFSFNLKILP